MPLLQTSGNVTADGYGGGKAAVPNYIEDVFSTYLYTGTSATQTITNGIDLSTKGGMLWVKNRSFAAANNIVDTVRGVRENLSSNSTAASVNDGLISSFTTSGFTLPNPLSDRRTNYTGDTYASWTFRKQPKFFDVVTWTGDGTVGRTIAHNLGSTPGCIIVKCTNNTTKWAVWHRSGTQSNRYGAFLNTTDAYTDTLTNLWGAAGGTPAMTSTSFSVGDAITTNDYFNTYVAYVFAHNAGGFGLTGTDNVISCGTFTTDASGYADVNLGYEPQWILMKASSAAENWITVDNMRGLVGTGTDYKAARLYPNLSNAEASLNTCQISSTGFKAFQSTSVTYIYIAIRRGPMKVPTSGTSVFSPVSRNGTGATTTITAGFPVDLAISKTKGIANPPAWFDRLRGKAIWLRSNATTSEVTTADTLTGWDSNTGVIAGADVNDGLINFSARPYANWFFQRAPNFFDEVCYTGTGVARTVTHNLQAVPELMIVKSRSLGTESWTVWNTTIASLNAANFLWLNSTSNIVTNSGRFNSTAPTSSVFTVGSDTSTNGSGSTYVAYLFATCAGVSKVGSYTGNGSSQTIACGFTGGARFVLIKRTDSTGDWYVYDTARGMTTLTDPYLLLNSTAAESATLGSVTTVSTGFAVDASILAAINTNAASYIFLAIA